jgi:hypothetical protein
LAAIAVAGSGPKFHRKTWNLGQHRPSTPPKKSDRETARSLAAEVVKTFTLSVFWVDDVTDGAKHICARGGFVETAL